MYKVNDGGAKLGSDGYYYYEPQIYYDKTNNKLYLEDINATGGGFIQIVDSAQDKFSEYIRGNRGNDDDPNYTGTYEEMTNTCNELGKPET